MILLKRNFSGAVVAYVLNLSTPETDVGRPLTSSPTQSTEWISGKPARARQRNPVSKRKKRKQANKQQKHKSIRTRKQTTKRKGKKFWQKNSRITKSPSGEIIQWLTAHTHQTCPTSLLGDSETPELQLLGMQYPLLATERTHTHIHVLPPKHTYSYVIEMNNNIQMQWSLRLVCLLVFVCLLCLQTGVSIFVMLRVQRSEDSIWLTFLFLQCGS